MSTSPTVLPRQRCGASEFDTLPALSTSRHLPDVLPPHVFLLPSLLQFVCEKLTSFINSFSLPYSFQLEIFDVHCAPVCVPLVLPTTFRHSGLFPTLDNDDDPISATVIGTQRWLSSAAYSHDASDRARATDHSTVISHYAQKHSHGQLQYLTEHRACNGGDTRSNRCSRCFRACDPVSCVVRC